MKKSFKPPHIEDTVVQGLPQRCFRLLSYSLNRSASPLQQIFKRSPRIAKINFEITSSSKKELEILSRNTKHLKSLNLDILAFRSSLEKLKKARSLKKIQISDDKYLSHRVRDFSCPKRDKQLKDIAKWIFRGRFSLEYLRLRLLSFEKIKKKYLYQLRKIPSISLTIDNNFSGRDLRFDPLWFKQITNAQLP